MKTCGTDQELRSNFALSPTGKMTCGTDQELRSNFALSPTGKVKTRETDPNGAASLRYLHPTQ